MLQRDPRIAAHRARLRLAAWWRRGPARRRLRRRLIVVSLPITLLLLVANGKIVSTMLTGDAAIAHFARHDLDALRDDVATLSTMNVIEPAQVSFIAADLAVLEGRLDIADDQFSAALARAGADQSCPVRVNLELVRETRGDLAARNGNTTRAEDLYNSALHIISAAPPRCFGDNADPNTDRRQIRNDAAARLADKIKALHLPRSRPAPPQTVNPQPPPTSLTPTTLPPPPAPGATSTPTPPPPPPTGGDNSPVTGPGGTGSGGPDVLDDISADRIPVSGNGSAPPHRLGTGAGIDPVDQLQRTLADAESTGSSSGE